MSASGTWPGVRSVLFLLLRQFLGKREKKTRNFHSVEGCVFLHLKDFNLQRTRDNINQSCRESEGKPRHSGLACLPSTSLVKKRGEQRFVKWLPVPAATRRLPGEGTTQQRKGTAFNLENCTDCVQSCWCLCHSGLASFTASFRAFLSCFGFPLCRIFVFSSRECKCSYLPRSDWLNSSSWLGRELANSQSKWLSAFFGISRSTETKSSPWAQQSLDQCRRWLRRGDSCYHLLLFCGCSNTLQLQWALNVPLLPRRRGFKRRSQFFLLLYGNIERIPGQAAEEPLQMCTSTLGAAGSNPSCWAKGYWAELSSVPQLWNHLSSITLNQMSG